MQPHATSSKKGKQRPNPKPKRLSENDPAGSSYAKQPRQSASSHPFLSGFSAKKSTLNPEAPLFREERASDKHRRQQLPPPPPPPQPPSGAVAATAPDSRASPAQDSRAPSDEDASSVGTPPTPDPIPSPKRKTDQPSTSSGASTSSRRKMSRQNLFSLSHGELDWSVSGAMKLEHNTIIIDHCALERIIPRFDILAFTGDLRYFYPSASFELNYETKVVTVTSRDRISNIYRQANNLLTTKYLLHKTTGPHGSPSRDPKK